MLKKKGNKKEGYSIIRTYTNGHQKITEPIIAIMGGKKQVLLFKDLEILSDDIALGTISEEQFIVYEIEEGNSFSILHHVTEFKGLKSYERFLVGVDLIREEYVIFRELEGCPIERLKARIRNKQFITGENIMLFKCGNKLKMLNFNCDKLMTFGNLVLLRGSLASVKSNWVLDMETGMLYKTTTSFKFEDVTSLNMRKPYIIFETLYGAAFAYMKGKNEFDVVETFVTDLESSYQVKEFFLGADTFKRGICYSNKGTELLHLDGNVYSEGSILTINKRRYKLSAGFELELITNEMIMQANLELGKRIGLNSNLTHKNYFVQDNKLHELDGKPIKASRIELNIFDDVTESTDYQVEFLLNDYILQQYTIAFPKEEFTKNFSTPISKVAKTMNGLSSYEQRCLCKTLYPRLFKNYFVFEELDLQKTIIVDLNKKELPRKTEMVFVMPIKSFLLGMKDDALHIEMKGLHVKCDFVKFVPEGLLIMGERAGEYYAFLIKDNGSLHEITEEKFVSADYYAIYDLVTWQNAYAKSLPGLFEDRKKLEKLNAF